MTPLPAESAPRRDAPLGLTVHDTPTPEALAAAAARRTRAGRWQMLLLALVCIAPVVASYYTYYVIRPAGRLNYGTLIEPQRPLPELVATDLQGAAVPLAKLKGQWLLVSVGGGACDATCESNLYYQRQLRAATGKDEERLDRVWLIDDEQPVPAALAPALQGATVLRVPRAALAAWLEPEAGQALADHLYVVDPMGHWMMRFPAGLDTERAARAKRDLARLLRASSAWDDAGRKPGTEG